MQPSVPNGATAADSATPAQLAVIDAAIRHHVGTRGALLPILHEIQEHLRYVPAAAVERIALGLNLSRAEVHGVLTFYHDFRTSPPGRTVVKLCRAEACQAMGCGGLERHLHTAHGLGMGQTSDDGAVTLEPVYCLGNCALSPSAQVDGELLGRVDTARLDAVIAAARAKGAS
ncbi:MAG: formate dehydrogenase subunit gamma [Planctomycetes bacterium]|nr:formate dehydrogenase subunit gamma [Planctomycetota bacterium]